MIENIALLALGLVVGFAVGVFRGKVEILREIDGRAEREQETFIRKWLRRSA